MSLPWFRLYVEILRDPKVMTMPEPMRWRLVALMALKCDGLFPAPVQDIAFCLRLSEDEVNETLSLFRERGFLCENNDLRNWEKRQPKSDSSTERVKKHRVTALKRSCNGLDKNREEKNRAEVGDSAPTAKASKRCPEGFVVPEDVLAKLSSELPTDFDIPAETLKFKDWEFKTPRSDWVAAWRNWMRRARDDGRYSKRSGGIKWQ